MKGLALAGLVLLISCVPARAGEPSVTFAAKPTTKLARGKPVIEFAVSGMTDVEVAILDAKGAVVRHLAAGVIGSTNPPPAPLKPGLSQNLEWDGKDDYGDPCLVNSGRTATGNRSPVTVHSHPLSVRVRAGMGVKLDKIVGGDPYAFWSEWSFQGDHAQWGLFGLEAKSDGNVYILSKVTSYGMGPAIRQYDAVGNYRRTVFPPPAGRSVDDVKGWGVHTRSDGTYTLKANFGWCTAVPDWTVLSGFQSGLPHLLPTKEAGALCLAASARDGDRQMVVGSDSTLRQFDPVAPFDGPVLPKNGPFFSALSADGKERYITGRFGEEKSAAAVAGSWRNGQVLKVDTASRKISLFFALDEKEMTPDRTGNVPANPYAAFHGVAVDADGNVFVCDRQNGRIAVVDRSGKLARAIPLADPDAIAVSPKSKVLYATTRSGNYSGNGELKLVKFGDWAKDDAPAATVLLRRGLGKFRNTSFLALAEENPSTNSGREGKTLVWVAYTTLPARVYRDTGAEMELVKDFYETGPQRALDLQHLMVDQKTGDAYISDSESYCFRVRDWKNPRFELCMAAPGKEPSAVGRVIGSPETRLPAASIAIDPVGRFLYGLNHYGHPVNRWKMDGEVFTAAPLTTGNALTPGITCAWIFEGLGQRGMAAAPGGGLATLGVVLADGGKHTDYSGPLHFFKPDPAKSPWQGLRFKGFGGGNPQSGGVRFDLRGNLYAGLFDGKPNNVPPGFEKDKDFMGTTGRIYKYAPTGTGDGGDWFPTEPAAPARIYDVHYGAFASANRTPRFGVDGYGRIYYPTCLLPQVSVIDNEGNPVLAFGTWGNRDSMGGLPGDLVPTKDVPMAWPNSVDATDDYIYVSDIINIRVLRMAKTFAAAEMVKLP